MDKEAIQSLTDKVVMESSIMALRLWNTIDYDIEEPSLGGLPTAPNE